MKIGLFIVKTVILLLILFFSSSFSNNYVPNMRDTSRIQPDFIQLKNKWIDSVFKSLSLEEKIGQMIVVAVYPTIGEKHQKNIEKVIQKYKPGALMFSKGTPVQQAVLTNRYQSLSKTPLLIAIDGEWGVAMRLDSVIQYPRQMLMGAIQNDKLIYDFGQEVANQCKELGIHVNFAPVMKSDRTVDTENRLLERYGIVEIFERHGVPDQILLYPTRSRQTQSAYGIEMIYQDDKILARYSGIAKLAQNDKYELCPVLGDGNIDIFSMAFADPADFEVNIIEFMWGSFNDNFDLEKYETWFVQLDPQRIYDLFIHQRKRCFYEDEYWIE